MSASPRLAALSGAAGVVLFDVGWFWDPAAPFTSDRRLATWYATHGDGAWLAAAALMMLAAPLFLVFAGAVRDRLAAGGASAGVQRAVYGSAKGFAIAVLVLGAVYAAVPAARTFTSVGAPSGDVSRFAGSAEFAVWSVMSTVLAATFGIGLVVAAFGGRALPRWLGAIVAVLVIPTLANVVLPMAGITLLFLAVSVALAATTRPRTAAVPAARTEASLPLGVPTR